jgi:hypothetical protein
MGLEKIYYGLSLFVVVSYRHGIVIRAETKREKKEMHHTHKTVSSGS